MGEASLENRKGEEKATTFPDDAFDKVLAEICDYRSANPVMARIVPPGGNVRISDYELGQKEELIREDDKGFYFRPGLYGRPAEVNPAADSGDSKPIPAYQKLLNRVFENTGTFEIVRNHNQALDVDITRALKTAGLDDKSLVTLVNFDAHSDLWRDEVSGDKTSIAQWINGILKKQPQINEVIWALPNNFFEDPKLRPIFFSERIGNGARAFVRGPADTKAYVNNETGSIKFDKEPEDYSTDKYRVVDIRKRPLSALPDLKGKNVILSTDLDGFDNCGHDTAYGAEVPWHGQKGFEDYLATLEDKGVKPFMHLVSVSPEYLRQEHIEDLLEFAARAGDASRHKMDQVVTNHINTLYGRTDHTGIRTEREGKPSLELLYRMFSWDQQSKDPDGILELDAQDPEYKSVVSDAQSLFGVDQNKAQKILSNFDAKDGKVDGFIEFMSIESLLVQMARSDAPEMKPRKTPDDLGQE